jgi:hypothetical protein
MLTASDPAPAGFLKIDTKSPDGKVESALKPYAPREGDLVFYDDKHVGWTLLFAYAGTGAPLHMGIVVKKDDGKFAILEAGPDDTVSVKMLDLNKRLKQFHRDFKGGVIHLRGCKQELAEEQSRALTRFAQAQDNKRYAVGRLLLQGTALRSRGPLLEKALGKTVLDRDAWICSELAVAAGTVAGLFDPKVVPSNVPYPRDLVNNERYNLSANWYDARLWSPVAQKK